MYRVRVIHVKNGFFPLSVREWHLLLFKKLNNAMACTVLYRMCLREVFVQQKLAYERAALPARPFRATLIFVDPPLRPPVDGTDR
jgi:hypothetical protein